VIVSQGTEIKWVVHPVKKNWKVSAFLVFFLIAICASIYFSFDSLIFLIISIVFLFCSLLPFFLPTTYILQDERIVVKSLFREISRQWDYFKRYYPDRNGVLLSPFPYVTRLENFRGLYLRFGNNRDDVIRFIKEKIRDNEGY